MSWNFACIQCAYEYNNHTTATLLMTLWSYNHHVITLHLLTPWKQSEINLLCNHITFAKRLINTIEFHILTVITQLSCNLPTRGIHTYYHCKTVDWHLHTPHIPWNTFSCNYITISNTRNVMEFCVYTVFIQWSHNSLTVDYSYIARSYNSSAITKKLFTHLLARGFRMCTVFIQCSYSGYTLIYNSLTVARQLMIS